MNHVIVEEVKNCLGAKISDVAWGDLVFCQNVSTLTFNNCYLFSISNTYNLINIYFNAEVCTYHLSMVASRWSKSRRDSYKSYLEISYHFYFFRVYGSGQLNKKPTTDCWNKSMHISAAWHLSTLSIKTPFEYSIVKQTKQASQL